MKKLLAVAIVAASLWLAVAETPTPTDIVTATVNTLAAKIDGRQQELEANPPALYALVNEVFLPVFDTDYAGRLILGRHWRQASATQRQQFIDAFYDFLLRTYAKSVLRFRKDYVRVLPPGKSADAKRAVVKTEIRLDDGTIVPVNYTMRLTAEGWRAFDVRIEGISYVQNYRNQFSAEIGAKGLDAVIARLRADSKAMDPASGNGGGKPAATGRAGD
jgi:phospholipid transport system substrate-binding protein